MTLPELGALVDTLRKAADDIPAADSSSLQRMWYEIASLRMEVRNAFIIKFTEGR